jgi:hypothetical protein
MAIKITRVEENNYAAYVTPPHGNGVEWVTPEPIPARELIDRLLERGCHQTDIGDAFYEADPQWLRKLT